MPRRRPARGLTMFAVYVPVHKKKLMFANMIFDQPPATPKDHVCEHKISGHVQGHEPLPRPSWGYPMFRDMELYVREHKPSSCSRTWHVREHGKPSWRCRLRRSWYGRLSMRVRNLVFRYGNRLRSKRQSLLSHVGIEFCLSLFLKLCEWSKCCSLIRFIHASLRYRR